MSASTLQTMRLPGPRTAIAPDGSDVRVLLQVAGGSMAHFELGPGETSTAVLHRTVEEIWFILGGRGEMWRRREGEETTVALAPGDCLTIPLGTSFQFRSLGHGPLSVIGVTLPPWPGEGEAVPADGIWTPTVTGFPASG
jgi:mannose-6-phosphate isomerase-like protein (cupin superfamily)